MEFIFIMNPIIEIQNIIAPIGFIIFGFTYLLCGIDIHQRYRKGTAFNPEFYDIFVLSFIFIRKIFPYYFWKIGREYKYQKNVRKLFIFVIIYFFINIILRKIQISNLY